MVFSFGRGSETNYMAFNPTRKTNRGISNCAGSDFQVDGEQKRVRHVSQNPPSSFRLECCVKVAFRSEIITRKTCSSSSFSQSCRQIVGDAKLGLEPSNKIAMRYFDVFGMKTQNRNCLWL
ncbi:Hypothetical_protein [Hexamita inflata]|uniref:Hypothetical_protein n=1 Tax=Hexamita inflata TaxID=28002 RepID=A0AA86NLP7_9EUKA|nr:Hypothetical protein HINF_LOCUS9035 [Hexamita inflata]